MQQSSHLDYSDHSLSIPVKATFRAWLVVIVASLFFFYEFIQMNMFNSISSSLMQAFHIDAEKLGILSSFYFIANVVFLFLAGILLDRYATCRVILIALGICIVGTALFSFSHSFAWACFFRFLTGIGSAFCFLSVIRLASRWFPLNHMALAIGLVLTIAMLGGWVSQAPMEMLAKTVHWRVALQIDALLGVLFFFLILLIVRDYPNDQAKAHSIELEIIHEMGFLKTFRLAFLRMQNWLGGLYVCFMNLPVGLLGGLWGVLYLTSTHNVSRVHASEVSSMLFVGTMIGSPLVGWISDKIQMRRPPMLVGALLSLVLISVVIFVPNLSLITLYGLFLLIGICSSAQIIGYPLVAENSMRVITAMSVSVVNISVQGGSAIFQPFFGYLLDRHLFSRLHHLSTHFAASDFSWAMFIFPAGFIAAIFIVFLLPETRCQQKE
ncbi:MAG: MFS transporter [Gammaproteobacteria bacterium RIFCSPHIGHO2_02_FULL_39_13]|nr:MAG: MFS transporter [Gammaproteobacteria bacterium RIFCSPHIGHO2_02_FULL_39_13]OGT48360.1 MAG: MFS transporter [Gammaproteobacteria bacterium RIFCSPHIGHO2_12_FULL_39_24]